MFLQLRGMYHFHQGSRMLRLYPCRHNRGSPIERHIVAMSIPNCYNTILLPMRITEADLLQAKPSMLVCISLSLLFICSVFSASWVRLATPIGEGAFSRVFEGVYRNPETLEESVVAVKILKKNMLKRRSDCLRFIKEAKIMTKISHKYVANAALHPVCICWASSDSFIFVHGFLLSMQTKVQCVVLCAAPTVSPNRDGTGATMIIVLYYMSNTL